MDEDIRPVRAIRLTQTEDWWVYDAINVWHLRGDASWRITRNVGRHTFSLYHGDELVREFDTLVAAMERGIDGQPRDGRV